ncbi:MAG TPA: nucleotidyltransferase family protein [Xanthobacteraceae bacterium]|nr:nucleotidyltransferase family protein [Xanthobacteraceae bacterium]
MRATSQALAAAQAIDSRMAFASPVSPEFLLTAACCRWPPSDESSAAIRAAVQDVTDWDRFLRVVKHHRVTVLVQRALRTAALEVPSAVTEELDALVQRNVRRGLKLAGETVRLQSLLAASGIPSLVLKGVALEQLAYGSIASKQTRDIDLLVPPEQAEAALALIERGGYTLSSPATRLCTMQRRALIRYGREIELMHPQTRVRVELQWRAADNPRLLSGVSAHAATQTVTVSEGLSVRTLAPDDLFAYLCVHGAHHSWSRLKWLADLNALVASSKPDLEYLYRHAQKIGAGLCAGQALLLCQHLFGLKLPATIAQELQTNKRCQRLAAVAIAAMTRSDETGERDVGIRAVVRGIRNQFLLGQGQAFCVAQCRLAYAGVPDIVRVPLPRPLHFIFPFLRLPLWLWRRAKLAFAPL